MRRTPYTAFASSNEALQNVAASANLPQTGHSFLLVHALYKGAFGRLAGSDALRNSIQQLQAGVSLEALAEELVASPRFQARHGVSRQVDTDFLTAVYRDGLGREPDPEGLTYWLAEGEKRATRAKVLAAFAGSEEAIAEVANLYVCSLYRTAFGRDANEVERANCIKQLHSGSSLESLAEGVVGSGEFQSRHGSGQKFSSEHLKALYYDGLGREPDPQGLAHWSAEGNRGVPRAKVLAALAGSDEALQKAVQPIFKLQPIASAGDVVQLPRCTGGRLICVSHVMPYPPRAGNAYRIHRMLTRLAQCNWDVLLVVSLGHSDTVPEYQLIEAATMYPNVIICQRDGTLLYQLTDRDTLEGLRGRRPRAFPPLLGEIDPGDERNRKLLTVMRDFCPDVLIELLLYLEAKLDPQVLLAEYVFMTRPFPLLRPSLFKIVDTHDVLSTTRDKVMRYGVDDVLSLDPEIEGKLLNRADLLIAIQEAEAELLRKLAPKRQVITVGIDFAMPKDLPPPASRPVILLVASHNPTNVKGLKDFLCFAWPLVRRALPESELWVIGAVGEVVERALPGVKILGQVEDLTSAYANARVVINPAVAGTGLKIKVIEAICHFRPVVVWPSGVDGIEGQVRELCHIATDWVEFAQHVIRLAGNQNCAQTLVDHRAKLAQYFAPDAVYAPLDRALEHIINPLRASGEPRYPSA